jgi:S-methylmethionine-dependent homocysteine/selenocysteine methylase
MVGEAVSILDGSMGRSLREQGVVFDEWLWSTTALRTRPDMVRELHADFIRAGADVVTTNTYGITPMRLDAAGIGDELDALVGNACKLAVEAREATGGTARLAGSVPPLRGSYRPDRVGRADELTPVYERMADALAEHVDVLLCETMSTAAEAATAAAAVAETGLPVWVSWTLADDTRGVLRSGEALAEATAALADLPVEALLVNCSIPDAVSAGVSELAVLTDRLVGGYANAFTEIPADITPGHTDQLITREDLSPPVYASFGEEWVARGATIIGGCCGIGPEHIAELSQAVVPR